MPFRGKTRTPVAAGGATPATHPLSPPSRAGRWVAPPPTPPPRFSALRSIGRFVRNWTIPVIGGITPVALILINIAVYINDNLHVIRWVIAVMAFVSGMILNSWWVLQAYRWVQQRWPHWSVVHQRNQEMALVIGMSGVTIFSFLTALFCFYGLGSSKNLPNAPTFWYGALQIALPFAAKAYFDRAERRAAKRNLRAGGAAHPNLAGSGPGPTPPSWPGAPGQGPYHPPAPPGGGGYVPPSYLPPS